MKILQIGLGNNPGGAEAFVMNYYRELVRRDIKFDFLCMYGKIAHEEEILRLGGNVYYVPNVKKDYFGYVKGVRKVLKQGSYDAVHVNMCSAANMVPLRLAKEAGVKKIIAHSHNSFAPGIVRKLMDACNRSKIDKYATAKIACGKVSAQWLFGEEACANQEVTLIRNAIDVDKYLFSMENRQKLRREFDWEGKFVIGHVGRFDTAKNHEGMIPIFKEIVKRRPDAVLCLIGDGVLKEQIRARVKENGMEKNVFFAGVRDNVEEFLSAMDVFFFPSLTEGVPFTMVEAQANGLPCVASDVITDEVFLSEDGTKRVSLEAAKEDWAKAILSYEGWKRKDPKEIKETLGRAHFDIEKEADRLLALYQE